MIQLPAVIIVYLQSSATYDGDYLKKNYITQRCFSVMVSVCCTHSPGPPQQQQHCWMLVLWPWSHTKSSRAYGRDCFISCRALAFGPFLSAPPLYDFRDTTTTIYVRQTCLQPAYGVTQFLGGVRILEIYSKQGLHIPSSHSRKKTCRVSWDF